MRTMNKIIFDKYLEETNPNDDERFPKMLKLPPPAEEKQVPEYGMKELERHKGGMTFICCGRDQYKEEPKDFTETFKDFCFSSLYIKEEVI